MKSIDDGTKRITRADARCAEDVADVIDELLALAPEGFTPWRVKAQRSSRGRRFSCSVVFASVEWIAQGAIERRQRRDRA